jgi:hypothetical protein
VRTGCTWTRPRPTGKTKAAVNHQAVQGTGFERDLRVPVISWMTTVKMGTVHIIEHDSRGVVPAAHFLMRRPAIVLAHQGDELEGSF